MALLPLNLPHFLLPPPLPPPPSPFFLYGSCTISSPSLVSTLIPPHHDRLRSNYQSIRPTLLCNSRRFYDHQDEDEVVDAVNYGFREAVFLFNQREYYKCHDYLEHMWIRAEEPLGTLFHGILQCAVGFHHLFNQNHRGAMMELGEGLCKLRKMNFKDGPFHQFECEISATLDFVYETQIELAACAEDLCIAMDRSERSYQLLGRYGAGLDLYQLQTDDDDVTYIVFCPEIYDGGGGLAPRTKLPTLYATEEHLQHSP